MTHPAQRPIPLAAMLTVFIASLSAQNSSVKITSPATRTVVRPGQRLTMSVAATPGAFSALYVPGWSDKRIFTEGPPYQVEIEIDAALPSDVYELSAVGIPVGKSIFDILSGSETALSEDTVELDVEREASPVRLTSRLLGDLLQPDGFHKVGESRVLEVTGHFSDGPDALLTRSKLTTYESSATSVVTVDGTGGVTAVGPGTARITVKNGNAILVVPVRVPNQQ